MTQLSAALVNGPALQILNVKRAASPTMQAYRLSKRHTRHKLFPGASLSNLEMIDLTSDDENPIDSPVNNNYMNESHNPISYFIAKNCQDVKPTVFGDAECALSTEHQSTNVLPFRYPSLQIPGHSRTPGRKARLLAKFEERRAQNREITRLTVQNFSSNPTIHKPSFPPPVLPFPIKTVAHCTTSGNDAIVKTEEKHLDLSEPPPPITSKLIPQSAPSLAQLLDFEAKPSESEVIETDDAIIRQQSRPQHLKCPENETTEICSSAERSKQMHMSTPASPDAVPQFLEGLTFLIAGSLPTLKRDEGEMLIKKYGGKTQSTISRMTSYVVLGKNVDAERVTKFRDRALEIIDENGLFDVIESYSGGRIARAEIQRSTMHNKILTATAEQDFHSKTDSSHVKEDSILKSNRPTQSSINSQDNLNVNAYLVDRVNGKKPVSTPCVIFATPEQDPKNRLAMRTKEDRKRKLHEFKLSLDENEKTAGAEERIRWQMETAGRRQVVEREPAATKGGKNMDENKRRKAAAGTEEKATLVGKEKQEFEQGQSGRQSQQRKQHIEMELNKAQLDIVKAPVLPALAKRLKNANSQSLGVREKDLKQVLRATKLSKVVQKEEAHKKKTAEGRNSHTRVNFLLKTLRDQF
jgi:hypothetical protein